ncbi:MAG: LuxR C-terminal-related transcriptional regulator [bacterium]
MAANTDALTQGREAFRRKEWLEAHDLLDSAAQCGPLAAEDLEQLALASVFVDKEAEGIEYFTQAHHAHMAEDNPARAARNAFWLAMLLQDRGDFAHSRGWVSRARRMLDDGGHDCVESGYLCLADALRLFFSGDNRAGETGFMEALRIGDRFHDTELIALARHGLGRALIRLGDIARGATLLDEALPAIAAREIHPLAIGNVYCSVIAAYHELFDLQSASEWTTALTEWCAENPTARPARGHCMVHRAEMMRFHGSWTDAMDEAERARQWFLQPPPSRAIGSALYQLGDLHRLRGTFDQAEEAYRQASTEGTDPQPGLALLRLAQGQLDVARTTIARALAESQLPRTRARVLSAAVDIALATADIDAAEESAHELEAIACRYDAPFLRGASAYAMGAVLLARGDARAALLQLRVAADTWRTLDAPHDFARTRVLIGRACDALGDAESAELEGSAARDIFERLGAAYELTGVMKPKPIALSEMPGGMTERELEVLSLLAKGKTNRAIAESLGISEKTVARHVSNLFTKIRVTSRAAATAYAYDHELFARTT